MRLMCWDVNVVHRADTKLVDADYWSRLGVDLQFIPLYVQYLTQTRQLRHANPPTVDLPMLPKNMPYYRGTKVKLPPDEAAVEASHIQTLLTDIVTNFSGWSTPLSIMPIQLVTLLMRTFHPCSILRHCITQNTLVMHFRLHSSLGRYTTSLTDISPPLLSPPTCHL